MTSSYSENDVILCKKYNRTKLRYLMKWKQNTQTSGPYRKYSVSFFITVSGPCLPFLPFKFEPIYSINACLHVVLLLRLKYTVLFLLLAIQCGSSPSLWASIIYINRISLLGFNVHVCGIWCSFDWCAATCLTPCRLTLLLPNYNAHLLSLFDPRPAVKCCRWVKKWITDTRSGSRCFHLKGMLSVPVLLLLAPCGAVCLYYSESKQALFLPQSLLSFPYSLLKPLWFRAQVPSDPQSKTLLFLPRRNPCGELVWSLWYEQAGC